MKNKCNFLKMDFYRLIYSRQLLVGSLAVFITYMVLAYIVAPSRDVFGIYFEIGTISPYVLFFSACAIPYATAFTCDLEYEFLHIELTRGKLEHYVCSKIITVFYASVVAMLLGTICFIAVKSLQLPISLGSSGSNSPFAFYSRNDIFGYLLIKNEVVYYLLFSSALVGMLAGLLSIIAMYISLYIKNKMLVIVLPMTLYYIQTNYIQYAMKLPDYFNLTYIYRSEIGAFASSFLSLIYAYFVAFSMIMVFTYIITKKLRRDGY